MTSSKKVIKLVFESKLNVVLSGMVLLFSFALSLSTIGGSLFTILDLNVYFTACLMWELACIIDGGKFLGSVKVKGKE